MRLFTGQASLYRSGRGYAGPGRAGTQTAGQVVAQQSALRFSRRLPGSSLVLRGRLFAIDGGSVDSCACWQVCDGTGGNCTPCECDPAGCGSC